MFFPQTQIGFNGECIKNWIKSKFKDRTWEVVYDWLPCNVRILQLHNVQNVALLYREWILVYQVVSISEATDALMALGVGDLKGNLKG